MKSIVPGQGPDSGRQAGSGGFPGGAVVKNLPANAEDTRDMSPIPGSVRSPGVGSWHLTPIFLLGKIHAQRSLVSNSPWGHRVRHD